MSTALESVSIVAAPTSPRALDASGWPPRLGPTFMSNKKSPCPVGPGAAAGFEAIGKMRSVPVTRADSTSTRADAALSRRRQAPDAGKRRFGARRGMHLGAVERGGIRGSRRLAGWCQFVDGAAVGSGRTRSARTRTGIDLAAGTLLRSA